MKDVLIVGAGPSGAAASYDLAKKGFSVQLLDKADFPRMKPCAGGLTLKTLKTLRFSVAPIAQRVCNDFVAGYGLEKSHLFKSPSPIAVMTVRSQLDAFCLEQSLETGARFERIEPIQAITRENDIWTVTTGNKRFKGRWLIGADGANSRVRHLLFPQNHVKFAFAAEACLPHPEPNRFAMEMNFNFAGRGYAWIFPKKDHLNVGIYGLDPMRGVKALLTDYCRDRLKMVLDPKTIIGHRIPYMGHCFQHTPDNALLVGDAAGMADPLLGEGLYNAVRSGQIAASAIMEMAENGQDLYNLKIGEITSDLKSYWSLFRFFYNHPSWGYKLLCSPPARFLSMKTARLGWTIGRARKNLFSLPFQSIDPLLSETFSPVQEH